MYPEAPCLTHAFSPIWTIEICWPAVVMSTFDAATGSRIVVTSMVVVPLAPVISTVRSYLSRLSSRSTEPKMLDRSGAEAAGPLACASVGASLAATLGGVVGAAVAAGDETAAVVAVGAVVDVEAAHAPTTSAVRIAAAAGRPRVLIGSPPYDRRCRRVHGSLPHGCEPTAPAMPRSNRASG